MRAEVVAAIERYAVSGGLLEFDGLSCACQTVWNAEITLERQLPVPLALQTSPRFSRAPSSFPKQGPAQRFLLFGSVNVYHRPFSGRLTPMGSGEVNARDKFRALPDTPSRTGEPAASRIVLTLFFVGVLGLYSLFSNVFGWDNLPLLVNSYRWPKLGRQRHLVLPHRLPGRYRRHRGNLVGEVLAE